MEVKHLTCPPYKLSLRLKYRGIEDHETYQAADRTTATTVLPFRFSIPHPPNRLVPFLSQCGGVVE